MGSSCRPVEAVRIDDNGMTARLFSVSRRSQSRAFSLSISRKYYFFPSQEVTHEPRSALLYTSMGKISNIIRRTNHDLQPLNGK